MAIIVTGATGQFGRAAAERLLKKVPAAELILTSRTPQKLADFAAQGAQVRYADFDKPETLVDAFKGGERMLLISTARVGSRVGQHKNAIDAAKAAGVKHVIYTSVLGAAEDKNPAVVKLDHRATEIDLEKSGLAWTFLRDSQYSEAVAMAIAPVAIPARQQSHNSGQGRVAFVSRDDCVDCAVACLTTPGHENKAYDLTGPELFTYPQMNDLLIELSGKPIAFHHISDDEMFLVFDSLGVPRHASDIVPDGPIPWSSDDMVTFAQSIREGYFDVLNDNVLKLTGHPPKTLRQVLLEYKAAWSQ